MIRHSRVEPRRARRGHTLLLFAIILPLCLGLVALCVDTAMIGVSQAELQTAADAGALAGAQQLADDHRMQGISSLGNEIGAANASAATIGQANFVLGQAPYIKQDTTNTGQGDIQVGYLDPNDPSSTLDTSTSSQFKYNSVQVVAARSANRVGVVPTFFAQIFGFNGSTVSARSTATAWPYTIAGFQGDGINSAYLLPIVLDLNTYNAMMAGTTQDQYTWDPTLQIVTVGADRVTESVTFPVGSGSPGNWGTIKIGISNNSTAILAAQDQYGITPSELAAFPNSTIALDPTLTPPSMTFSGNPGMSAGIERSLVAIIGRPVTIPIYDMSGGSGNNAWFRVVAFAGVRIMAVNFQGNPKYVVVQPALVRDPLALPGVPQSSWTSGGLVKLHLSR